MEFVKAIEENIDTLDDEMAKQKLQEHRMCQIKFLEDLDSERIQRKNLLAQKLRTSKVIKTSNQIRMTNNCYLCKCKKMLW